jgi:hypothetical protein
LYSINIRIIIYSGLIYKVLSITYSRLLRDTYINYNAIEFFRGIAFIVIYTNRSYSRSVTSIIGLIGILIGCFLGVIKCIKERSANTVVILKA